ncbi:MAG TPA: DUF2520 domain-containing protein [Acidimicrobiales bacterium]|nr:DUF2520 domain-containing protein [Acidimicrobiales bacterium]
MGNPSFRVVGAGRAGGSVLRALVKVGWTAVAPLGRADDISAAAAGVDVLIIATPDAAIAGVARAVEPVANCAVVHLSGSLGPEALAPHARRAVVHPIMGLPDEAIGTRRLLENGWFALTDGCDPVGAKIVEALGGRAITLADDADMRALHHAACCVAGNHLVTMLGQVERLAAAAGVSPAAYFEIVRAVVDNVEQIGAAAALTGPVARGDYGTVERHRGAIAAHAPGDLPLYDALLPATEELARCK